jgi:hypothetical protein
VADIYYEDRSPMKLETMPSIDDQSWVYKITVSKALMEECPADFTKFEGLFNATIGVSLVKPDSTVEDCVILHMEGLAAHLMRLAYIAAFHEEGPYGCETD